MRDKARAKPDPNVEEIVLYALALSKLECLFLCRTGWKSFAKRTNARVFGSRVAVLRLSNLQFQQSSCRCDRSRCGQKDNGISREATRLLVLLE